MHSSDRTAPSPIRCSGLRTALRRACALAATLAATLALSGCDRLQSLLDDAAGPDDGWATQTTQSPVHGTEYLAEFTRQLDVEHDIREQIDITCIKKEKNLSVKFYLYGDNQADPDLTTVGTGLLGIPVQKVDGSALTARSDKPQPAWHGDNGVVAIGEYKNELVLNPQFIRDLPQELPLALEIRSNQGTVTFQIPKSDTVMGVVHRCVADQPAATSASDAATAADASSPASAVADAPSPASATDTASVQAAAASAAADAAQASADAAAASAQAVHTDAATAVPAESSPANDADDGVIAQLQAQNAGKPYSVVRAALIAQGYAPDKQASAGYADNVANDPAQCAHGSCSVPWFGNGTAFCVGTSMAGSDDAPAWNVDAVERCQ